MTGPSTEDKQTAPCEHRDSCSPSACYKTATEACNCHASEHVEKDDSPN